MSSTLGITGAIGSGKSTVARLLTDLEPAHAFYETSQLVAELADDFNRALSGELAFETTHDDMELVNQAFVWFIEAISEKLHRNVTWSQLAITPKQRATQPELYEKLLAYLKSVREKPALLTEPITPENKTDYRPLLQWLGGYLIAKVSKTIWFDELIHRVHQHDNDKNLIVIAGVRFPAEAEVIRQEGGRVIGIIRTDLEEPDLDDPTEASRVDIEPDITIINNGTLDELQTVVETLWNDLTEGAPPKNEYAAKKA